ncbi:MAG: leucine-rich repeat domain-containing protein [Bacteroidales bacterium]|nr:leucine-rich repeat domain-containing protein [Bacteroidales bacterium]
MFLIVAILSLLFFSNNVQADEFVSGYLSYSIDNENNATITGYTSIPDGGVVTIPESVADPDDNSVNYSVTSIGYWAFSYCRGVTSLTIPNSVTSIGSYAFFYCSSLTSVTIPNSVTSIGDYAFSGCSGHTTVTIPNSVTSIGDGAFYGCSGLTTITIPNSVTSIGKEAFSGCSNITTVTIPKSVISIGKEAFFTNATTTIYCETALPKPEEWNENWNCGSYEDLIVPANWGCQVIRGAANDESFGSVTANDAAAVKADDGSLWYLADATNISATLIATPAEGYHFVQWEDDAEAGATRVVSTAQSQPYKAIFAKDEPTAISTTEQNSLAVSAYGRNILVKNATGEVLVYDTTGRLIAREMPARRNVISVAASGIYVVKVGSTVKRVLVK